MVPTVLFPVIMGSLALQQTLSRSRMLDVRGVDIVSLMGAGACFGVALMGLILILKKKI